MRSGGEQGLLSVAFHPQFAKNQRFFVDYTDVNGNTRVVEYRSNAAGTQALTRTRKQWLFVAQPYENHNGGQVAFGPDGRLYVGMGDGGSGGDPQNRAQNMGTLLGKLVRINVAVSKPNPQIAALGVRNPWRFSFDRANGDLYMADVGQNAWEEIDWVPRAQLTRARELRLGRIRGTRAVRVEGTEPARAPGLPRPRVRARRRVLGHGRLRLSRVGGTRGPGAVLLRGLLHGDDLVARDVGRPRDRRAPRGHAGRKPLELRPGRPRRAVRDVARRTRLPPRALAALSWVKARTASPSDTPPAIALLERGAGSPTRAVQAVGTRLLAGSAAVWTLRRLPRRARA